ITDTTNKKLVLSTGVTAAQGWLVTPRADLPYTGTYRIHFSSFNGYHGAFAFVVYDISDAPEHRGPVMPVDTEVANERIDRPGDLDEFSFQATAGQEYNAFVQAAIPLEFEIAPQGVPGAFALGFTGSDT